MKNKMKKLAAVICVGAMALTSTPAALAAEMPVNYQQQPDISPYWTLIKETQNNLRISGRTGTVDCWVKGHVINATKAKIVAELQEKSGSSWKTIASYEDTQYDYMASVYESKTLTSGKTYRVVTTVTVWEGSQSESHTTYGVEKTV